MPKTLADVCRRTEASEEEQLFNVDAFGGSAVERIRGRRRQSSSSVKIDVDDSSLGLGHDTIKDLSAESKALLNGKKVRVCGYLLACKALLDNDPSSSSITTPRAPR